MVFGAAGMLGHALCRSLAASRFTPWAAVRTEWSQHPILHGAVATDHAVSFCDVLDEASVVGALERASPDVVVNCVGMIKQRAEAANAELSIAVNALAPHRLARLCDRIGAKLIQPGTDCVFSGNKGQYTEDDIPDPLDLYGRTKFLGEVTRAPHLTIRTSIIGWQLSGSEGLAEWFRSQRGKAAQGWTGAIFSGLTTYALADIIVRLIAQHPRLSGLHHVAAAPISKFDLLSKLNSLNNFDIDLAKVEGLRIDRSLSGEKFSALTGIRSPGWDEMLAAMALRRSDYDQAIAATCT
ncbi:hypothetical protein IP69_18420 [Bosea sp. AAP35]|nr:hypothetical protein IP69_18420 [Bosea sp. AAP35]